MPGILRTSKHYNNGKIKADMQLALCGSKEKPPCFFAVTVDIFEGLPNNRYGKAIGSQFSILTIDGIYLKENNPTIKGINNTGPLNQNTIDKKYTPWVMSAIKFIKEITGCDERF